MLDTEQHRMAMEQDAADQLAYQAKLTEDRRAASTQHTEEAEVDGQGSLWDSFVEWVQEKAEEVLKSPYARDMGQLSYALEKQGMNQTDAMNLANSFMGGKADVPFTQEALADMDALAETLTERAEVSVDVGMQGRDLADQWKAEEAATRGAERAGAGTHTDQENLAAVEAEAKEEADKAGQIHKDQENVELAQAINAMMPALQGFHEEQGIEGNLAQTIDSLSTAMQGVDQLSVSDVPVITRERSGRGGP